MIKKIATILTILPLLFPSVLQAAPISAGWVATSTNKGYISPNPINGNIPYIQVPYVTATTTTASVHSTFPNASTTNLSAQTLTVDGNQYLTTSDSLSGIFISGTNPTTDNIFRVGPQAANPGVAVSACNTSGDISSEINVSPTYAQLDVRNGCGDGALHVYFYGDNSGYATLQGAGGANGINLNADSSAVLHDSHNSITLNPSNNEIAYTGYQSFGESTHTDYNWANEFVQQSGVGNNGFIGKFISDTTNGAFGAVANDNSEGMFLGFGQFNGAGVGTNDIFLQNGYAGGSTYFQLLDGFGNVSTNFQLKTGGVYNIGPYTDSTGSNGTNGMVLQTTGSITKWVATSTLGLGLNTTGLTNGYAIAWNGSNLVATGTVAFTAPYFIATSTTHASTLKYASTTDISISDLTSGRVPFSTTGGMLTDSSNLTYTSGTPNLTVTSNGSSAVFPLTIYNGGASNTSSAVFGLEAEDGGLNTNHYSNIEGDALGNFNIYTGATAAATLGTNAVTITKQQKFGIGTTTPGTILSVNGVANFLAAGSTLYSPITFPYFTATSTSATSTISTGGFAVGTNQLLVQSATGNVGMGSTSPSATLSILGSGSSPNTLFVQGSVGASGKPGTSIILNAGNAQNSTGTDGGAITIQSGNGSSMNSGNAGVISLQVGTVGNRYLTLNGTGGNVGIGTSTPAFTSDLKGSLLFEPISAPTVGKYTGVTWNDLTQNELAYSNGNTLYQGGNLYTATADQVINTTSPTTSFSSTKVGTTVIKANSLKVGQKFLIWGSGYYSTPALNTSTVTLTTSIASSTATTISTVTTGAFPASATNFPFDFTLQCTVRSIGSTATIVCDGSFNYATALSAVAKTSNSLSTVGTIVFDSTVDETMDVKASWSAVTTQSATIQESKIDFM